MTYTIEPAWDYRSEDKERIAHALNDKHQLGEETIGSLVIEVTEAARHYRGLAGHEQARPLPAQVRAQIARLDRAITDFQTSFGSLSEEAQTGLDDFAITLDGHPVTPAILNALRHLTGAASTVGAAADKPAKRGQPAKKARRWFVQQLAQIWARAHDAKWPARSHDWRTGKDYGPFHDFVRASLAPLGGQQEGLDDVIRAVCDMGNNTRAHG
jgi:hypothetical protein